MNQTIYLLDANVIIELVKSLAPIIDGLDRKITEIIAEGRMISVYEVFQELTAQGQDDAAARWAKRHRAIFHHPEREEAEKLKEILARASEKAGYTKPYNADPWLIAFAQSQPLSRQGHLFRGTDYAVVALDGGVKALADKFRITCLTWKDVFRKEGWSPKIGK